MRPAQIPGLYQNVPIPPYSPACPDYVRVRQVEPLLSSVGVLYVIPHQFISIPFAGGGEQQCAASAVTSDFTASSATVLRRSADLRDLDTNNSLIFDFTLAEESFFLGTEVGARRCGALATSADSVSMWMAPSRLIQSQAGRDFRINFKPGFKYIYYFSASTPCLLKGDGAEEAQFVDVPPPSASASPTPASTDSDVTILSPVPIPSAVPTAPPAAAAAAPPVLSGSSGGGGSSSSASGAAGGTADTVGSGGTGGAFNGGFGSDFDVLDNVQVVSDGASQRACFAAHARVWTPSGAVRMDALRVHERVLVGARGAHSRVLGFTHADARALHRFVRVRTAHNRSVALSGGHFALLAGRRQAARRADQLALGDQLLDVRHGPSAVTQLTREWALGLYNAQTQDGRIVVDGLLLSTYTAATRSVGAAHALLAPVRALYAVLAAPVGAS